MWAGYVARLRGAARHRGHRSGAGATANSKSPACAIRSRSTRARLLTRGRDRSGARRLPLGALSGARSAVRAEAAAGIARSAAERDPRGRRRPHRGAGIGATSRWLERARIAWLGRCRRGLPASIFPRCRTSTMMAITKLRQGIAKVRDELQSQSIHFEVNAAAAGGRAGRDPRSGGRRIERTRDVVVARIARDQQGDGDRACRRGRRGYVQPVAQPGAGRSGPRAPEEARRRSGSARGARRRSAGAGWSRRDSEAVRARPTAGSRSPSGSRNSNDRHAAKEDLHARRLLGGQDQPGQALCPERLLRNLSHHGRRQDRQEDRRPRRSGS